MRTNRIDSARNWRGAPAPHSLATDSADPSGVVVCYSHEAYNARNHESVTRCLAARKLAALKGYGFSGDYDHTESYAKGLYFVPSRTLLANAGDALGIRSADDLFGGVVPHPFVGTKTITHAVLEGAYTPEGWSHAFPGAVKDAVLDGYAAFSREDAARAGAKLLQRGPVRVKPALGVGGRGQTVVADTVGLRRAIEEIEERELSDCGVTIEQNLADAVTYSVGQVHVGKLVGSYYGTQRLARDNHGAEVYGGSDLVIVRGDFDALLALDMPADARGAVTRAKIYDAAAHTCYPGFFASRRNYDVVHGRDATGATRCGVLEQSWRIGGASGAEIAALECFRDDPDCRVVHARTVELYGEDAAPPADAVVYFSGEDDEVGFITKFTVVDKHVDA